MLFGRVPGVRRAGSRVWWLTVATFVALAAAIVGAIVGLSVVAGR